MKIRFAQCHHERHCEGSPTVTWDQHLDVSQMAVTPTMRSPISSCGLRWSKFIYVIYVIYAAVCITFPSFPVGPSRCFCLMCLNLAVFCPPCQLEMVQEDGQFQELKICCWVYLPLRSLSHVTPVRKDCSKPHTRPLGLHCGTTHWWPMTLAHAFFNICAIIIKNKWNMLIFSMYKLRGVILCRACLTCCRVL